MAMTAKIWTVTGLASELGRDRRTISGALRDVPPDGKSGRFDGWYITTAIRALAGTGHDGLDLTAERARLAAAQAKKAERENALAEGELVTVQEVHISVTSAFARVRSRLLALPSKLTPMIAATSSKPETHEIIKGAIYDALSELAGTNVAGIPYD